MQPQDPALARTAGRARSPFTTIFDGFRAFPAALALLARTPRVVRLLLPPVVLAGLVFAAAFTLLYGAIDSAFDAAASQAETGPGTGEGWIAAAVRWTLENPAMGFVADIGRWVFFLLAAYLVAIWTFSLVYEALAGPFLEVVHGRIEARWFAGDPRGHAEASKPRNLFRILFAESAALFVSLKAAAFALMIMVLFFWVKFIPVIGIPAFLAIAGFATGISMLDIPLSRRRWSFRQRLRFLGHHLMPVTAFGLTASGLFVLLPLVGLLITVPLSSVGSLWLVCRLDKDFMRPSA